MTFFHIACSTTSPVEHKIKSWMHTSELMFIASVDRSTWRQIERLAFSCLHLLPMFARLRWEAKDPLEGRPCFRGGFCLVCCLMINGIPYLLYYRRICSFTPMYIGLLHGGCCCTVYMYIHHFSHSTWLRAWLKKKVLCGCTIFCGCSRLLTSFYNIYI